MRPYNISARLVLWLLVGVALIGALLLDPCLVRRSAVSAEDDLPLSGKRSNGNGSAGRRELRLRDFRPVPRLKVAKHHPQRSRFPVIDVHTHFLTRAPRSLDDFVKLMDEQNIAICVSLDGRWGDLFTEHRKYLWTKYADRFAIFVNIDWRGAGKPNEPATWDCHRPDFAHRVVKHLEDAKKQGASGVKLFKEFGLHLRNPDGSPVAIDDPRWDPIWEACGRLSLPVLMHTADPSAFFLPVDEKNERWEELSRHPEWSFYGPEWPKRDELFAARNRVIERHDKTLFIAAHMANDAEDLNQVSQWLDDYANLHLDITSRIAELGRQPYTARRFFIKYADRIMFGTDGPRSRERLLPHWRFLETFDEYFPYSENAFPPQGFWHIYGIGLPDDVLKKGYYENALRIIPGLKEKWETRKESRQSVVDSVQ